MGGLLQLTGDFLTQGWHRVAVVERVDEFFDANFCRFRPLATGECRSSQFERNVANVKRESGKGFLLGGLFTEPAGTGKSLRQLSLIHCPVSESVLSRQLPGGI